MSEDDVLLNRREMMKMAGTTAAIPCLVQFVSGCGGAMKSDTLGKTIELDLDDPSNAALKQNNGVVKLSTSRTGTTHPIFVVRQKDAYLALSAECTHASCEIKEKGNKFSCPCHGSQFSFDGSVKDGPADAPLHEFPTEQDGNTLRIG